MRRCPRPKPGASPCGSKVAQVQLAWWPNGPVSAQVTTASATITQALLLIRPRPGAIVQSNHVSGAHGSLHVKKVCHRHLIADPD